MKSFLKIGHTLHGRRSKSAGDLHKIKADFSQPLASGSNPQSREDGSYPDTGQNNNNQSTKAPVSQAPLSRPVIFVSAPSDHAEASLVIPIPRHASTTPSTPESERKRLSSSSPPMAPAMSPSNTSHDSNLASLSDSPPPVIKRSGHSSSHGSFNESSLSGFTPPVPKSHTEESLARLWQDVKGNPRPELVMNKSKNDKFHKIFKDVPVDEHCLKSYSCAYQGDILIQGFLYISPNWFCFYSRILGIEKQIKIPVKSVLNLTREKTAIFIPNAIGIVTAKDKYVFGTLLSRDNTFRVMHTVWKALTEPTVIEDTSENGLIGRNSCDEEESENSICIACGQHTGESPHDCPAEVEEEEESAGPEEEGITPVSDREGSFREKARGSTSDNSSTQNKKTGKKSTVVTGGSSARTADSQDKQPSFSTLTSSTSSRTFQAIRNMPRTQLTLFLCVIMVVILACTSVILLHKILVLQARLETRAMMVGSSPLNSDQLTFESSYFLQHEKHHATIEQLHTVLKANIVVLDQVYVSMKHLAESMDEHSKPVQNGSHSHDET